MKNIVKKTLMIFAFGASAMLTAADLPYIAPEAVKPLKIQSSIMPGGAVQVKLGNANYVVNGDFSLQPGWAKFTADKAENFSNVKISGNKLTAQGKDFTFERTIRNVDEAVIVTDRITNTGKDDLPFMYRQYLTSKDKPREYRLCGRRIYGRRGSGSSSINCTAIVMPPAGGSIGLLALNDVFRVHFRAFAAKGMYGIGDDDLIIRPGVTQEMSFAVFPSDKADYYSQINAMRRYLGVNYELKEGFAFLSPNPPNVVSFAKGIDRIGMHDSVETIREWIYNKSANMLSAGAVKQNGELSHGSAWVKTAKPEIHKEFYKKVRQAKPGAKILHYYHSYLDVKSKMDSGFDDARNLKPNGEQADYRNPALPLFITVEGSKWSKMQEERLERLRTEYGVDGIFWDEFPQSASKYHFGEPWDGVTGDIHPRTHKITGRKTSVALITLPWRKRMVESFAKNGLFLVANGGGGYTRTMTDLFIANKYTAFMETGSIAKLTETHLFTPIGLGDHLTERSEEDCYRNQVRHLNYGSLYYYYHQQVEPFTHPTLAQYMYPITPVELHEGYIIGKERILTNRSGYYSFGGKENAELHFFGADGREVKRDVEKVVKNNKNYYKVVLAENESCAIVKK